MALGFNNAPVDWDTSQYTDQGLASAGNAIAQAIQDFRERKEKKKREEDAAAYIAKMMPNLSPEDIKAGVKGVGAENVIKMGQYQEMKERDDQIRREAKRAEDQRRQQELVFKFIEMERNRQEALRLGRATDAEIGLREAKTKNINLENEAIKHGGERKPLEVTLEKVPNMVALQTGPQSWTYQRTDGGELTPKDRTHIAAQLYKKEIQDYIKKTRGAGGSPKDGFFSSVGPKDIDPGMEAIIEATGMVAFEVVNGQVVVKGSRPTTAQVQPQQVPQAASAQVPQAFQGMPDLLKDLK